MQIKASELTSGMFVYLPIFLGTGMAGKEYQGPITVEFDGDTVQVHYPNGTWETDNHMCVAALPRPTIHSSAVLGCTPLELLTRCSDRMIQAGWPALAREQFLEHAQKGGLEHLLYTIRDVFEVQK